MNGKDLEEALAETGHTMAEVRTEDGRITSIRLLLSNGRRIVVKPGAKYTFPAEVGLELEVWEEE